MKLSSKPLSSLRSAPSTRFHDVHKLQRQPANNKKGYKRVYVYCGDWYVWTNTPKELNVIKLVNVCAVIAAIVLYMIAALQVTDVNMNVVVGLPAMCSIIPMLLMVYGVFQQCRRTDGGKMTVIIWSDVYRRLKTCALIYTVLIFLAFAACIYRFFVVAPTGLSVFVTLSYLVCAVFGLLVFLCCRRLKYKTVSNPLSIDRKSGGNGGKAT